MMLKSTPIFASPINSQPGLASKWNSGSRRADLICFSHLRWDFVFQRPQHLLTRCAKERRVYFVEEPIYGNGSMHLHVSERDSGVHVVVPHLPEGLQSEVATTAVLREMVRQMLREQDIEEYVFWYYTPMALPFTNHFSPLVSVYDCMDQLSAFKGADSNLPFMEKELFKKVDLVFTGGQTLYEAKRELHHAVHAFPSSIDIKHFGQARDQPNEPVDQVDIPHPRLGFFGVIDERFDIELLQRVAAQRPEWQFIMIGPVVKIHPGMLPRAANIHYLGAKSYADLPQYLAHWDVALLLFARNESTRFISPTKTPEYLAAGKPVISTSIRDVVRPYGELELVEIADAPDQFIAAAEKLLNGTDKTEWLKRVDEYLSGMSWNQTWSQMSELITQTAARNQQRAHQSETFSTSKRPAGATVAAF
jgi:UDP-galactopyranose mutase